MKLRHVLFAGYLLLGPGCAFFGVEQADCLPGEDCSASIGDGDGDQPGDGDGDGDVMAAGGGGGDGDGGTDGDGDGDGDSPSGGRGMGGAPSGGSGGAPDGGSGGISAGGTGGDSTGGAGGSPDGGTGGMHSGGSGGETGGTGGMSTGGTGGTGVADYFAREIQINEIHPQFVEVYFVGVEETSLNLDDFRIVVNDQAGQACELTGGAVDESNRFLVAQRGPAPCLGGGSCVVNCPFPSIGTDVEVRLEMLIGVSYEQIDAAQSAPFVLTSDSYQATTDGGNDFSASPPNPGASNN